MLLTMETEYAIRIVGYLMQNHNITKASEIAKETGVPLRFAKNILQKLTGKGITSSYKGISGGYKLGRQPEDISLYDVLDMVHGPIDLSYRLKENKNGKEKKFSGNEILEGLFEEMVHSLREIRFSSGFHSKQ